jgi:glycine/D-amino acid oxidase-like deaminating enzyme
MKKKRIAILGAGGLGTCTALELAQRGYEIDLFEENNVAVGKASFVNEGKIHLGFIYAMDQDLKTSRHMITGALHFIDCLNRWISIDAADVVSTPFNYCVHKGSLMSPDQLNYHYSRCIDFFNEAKSKYKKNYLGLDDTIFAHQLSPSQSQDIANPEFIDAVFRTSERSVEPRAVAMKLRKALENHPKIHLHLNTKVLNVTRSQEKLQVCFQTGSTIQVEIFPEVINSTWNGLLEIDRTMGIKPPESWSHRYKFGNKILTPLLEEGLPSCTMVQGPYGDTVNFGDRGAFLSWYPIGRTGWSEDLRPPEWDRLYSPEQRMDVFQRSFDQLVRRIPALAKVEFKEEHVQPVGGVIYALGNTDVENRQSKLHTRYEVGMTSYDNYHSVNTGKYTLIPWMALQIAKQISSAE